MEKKNLDWANIGFEYVQTDKRYVANYKDGKWDGRDKFIDERPLSSDLPLKYSIKAANESSFDALRPIPGIRSGAERAS